MSSIDEHLLGRRIVRIWGPLGDETASRACAQLMAMDATGDTAVTLYLASSGGPLHAAMTVVDTIDLLGVPVEVTCMSAVENSAVAIAAAGTRRIAAPHARFHLAQPQASSTGNATQLAAWADHYQRELALLVARLAMATGRPGEHIEADLSMGRWLSAQEAVAYGLIDEIWAPRGKSGEDGGRTTGYGRT